MSVFSTIIELVLRYKVYLVIASAILYVAKIFIDSRALQHFKGPWLAKYTDLWFAKAAMGNAQHAVLADVCSKYGPISRIGPDTLVTTSAEFWMRMSAARSQYTKAEWYNGVRFPPGQDNIFSMQDEVQHTKRRAQMAEGYAGKTNPTLEPTISHHVQNFVDLLRRKYISTNKDFKPIDMGRKASFFTMDVITDVAFGQPFGNLVTDTDTHDYIQNTEDMLHIMIKLCSLSALRKIFLSRFGMMLFPSDKSEKGVGKLMGIAKSLASKRFAAKDTDIRQDMQSSFIKHGLTESDVIRESILQIIAGADTTATAIRSIMLHTLTTPHVYQTLQKEFDTAIADGRVTGEGIIKDSQASELVYLQAVVKESLRVWPPVTGMLSKKCLPEGDTFTLSSGETIHIPGNTEIGWASWGMFRDKSIFGIDAEIFRPERWLPHIDTDSVEDKERLATMDKVIELIFGYGKYQCLGKNVAWLEMNKVVFELFSKFDFQIVNPARPWRCENFGLWLQSEMWVKVRERE